MHLSKLILEGAPPPPGQADDFDMVLFDHAGVSYHNYFQHHSVTTNGKNIDTFFRVDSDSESSLQDGPDREAFSLSEFLGSGI